MSFTLIISEKNKQRILAARARLQGLDIDKAVNEEVAIMGILMAGLELLEKAIERKEVERKEAEYKDKN